MASSLDNDTAAARLRQSQESAAASLEAPSQPSREDAGVAALRDEIAASPALHGASGAAPHPPQTARAAGPRVEYVPTAAIRPLATLLPRRLEPANLRALATSLRRHGMALPLLVRVDPQRPGMFELFVGYRRWRAALLAGLAQVPVTIFADVSDAVALEINLLENLHRRDLGLTEEAKMLRVLADRHGRTHAQLAALSGRTPNQVANMLCLLALPDEVQVRLRRGQLSYAHGRALLGLEDPAALARRAVEERLSVRETERLAAQWRAATQAGEPPPAPPESPPDTAIPSVTTDAPDASASPSDLRSLRVALAAALGAPLEVRADAGNSTLLIQAGSPAQVAGTVALLRDALRLLCTDPAIIEASRNRRMG
jgi:ParB family transcriptional regulator, chromosome partitioning protein